MIIVIADANDSSAAVLLRELCVSPPSSAGCVAKKVSAIIARSEDVCVLLISNYGFSLCLTLDGGGKSPR